MNRLAKRLIFAQAMDVVTFVAFFTLIPVSIHTEQNPLVATMFALGGFQLVAFVKMGLAVVVGHRASHRPSRPITHRWYPALHVIAISTATASGVAGAGFNLASLVDSL